METFSEYEKRYNKFINKMEKNDVNRSIQLQSSLKVSLEFFRDKGFDPGFLEWLRLSQIIADFTNNGLTTDIIKVAKAFDEYLKKHKE